MHAPRQSQLRDSGQSGEVAFPNITAAILAGGLGTRLRAVVTDRPKALAEVHGRPFLSFLLDQLAAARIRDVVLCIGYRGEQVRAAFGDAYGGLRLRYSQERELLGTAGALRLALPLLQSDPVLVMNGDSFCETDLRAFARWHWERGAEATLLLVRVPDAGRYGRVEVDAAGRVLRFEEKGSTGDPGWVNAGVYLLSRRLLGTIPAGRPVSLEHQVFPAWIGRGLYGYRTAGRFLDIGTPEAYAMAEAFFAPEVLG